MRTFSPFASLALIFLLAPVACSGEDDAPEGTGTGTGAGAKAGAAGAGSLGISGRAGTGGQAGQAGAPPVGGSAGAPPVGGQGGNAGSGGEAGKSGAGQAGQGGQAGQAGQGGQAGQAGQAGSGGGPVAPVCGDGVTQPSELCEGDLSPGPCSAFFEDGDTGTETATCSGCYASTASCRPFANGVLDAPLETDIDCGKGAQSLCGLGFDCVDDDDCDPLSGLRCLAGTCNEATLVVTTDLVAANPGVAATNGMVLRTALPLPAGAVVDFDATIQKAATAPGTVETVIVPAVDATTPRHGRTGAVKLKTTGVSTSTELNVDYGVTIGGSGGKTRVSTTGKLVVFPSTSFTAVPLTLDIQQGACSSTGETAPSFPKVGTAIDVPVGLTVCAVVKGLSASLSLDSLRIGDRGGSVVGGDRATVTLTKQPLSEGLPAAATLDVVFTFRTPTFDHGIFPAAVRATALTLTGVSTPATNSGLGTPGSPRYVSPAVIDDTLPVGTQLQLVDTLEIDGPITLPGRLDGGDKGVLKLTKKGASVTLASGGVLQDIAVTAKDGGLDAACVRTPLGGTRSMLRGVSIDACPVGLAAVSDVVVSETDITETGTAIALGKEADTPKPPVGVVLGGTVTTSKAGIAITDGKGVVRETKFENTVVGLTIGNNADATVVGATMKNANVGINVVGAAGNLVLVGGTITGEGEDPPGVGLDSEGGEAMKITLRGVGFSQLLKTAIRSSGRNQVDVYGGSVATSGSKDSAAIEARNGTIRLFGTAITGTTQTLVAGLDDANGVTHGRIELLAGTRIEGGGTAVVAEGASELRVQDSTIRGASKHAVDIRTGGAWSLTRTFLVSPATRAAGAPLLNVDYGANVPSPPKLTDVRLQAGAGETLISTGQTCGSYADVVGGPYLALGANTNVCF